MAKNIELRHNTWYATLHVPKDVRDKLGASKLFQSLKTTNKKLACERAMLVVGKWKAEIEQARVGVSSIFLEAMKNREMLPDEMDAEVDEANYIAAKNRAEEIADKYGEQKGQMFLDVFTGKKTLLEPHVKPWIDNLKTEVVQTTLEKYLVNANLIVNKFEFAENITKKEVLHWVTELGTSIKSETIQKILTAGNSLWRYLQLQRVVDIEKVSPFSGVQLRQDSDHYDPYDPRELLLILERAEELKDSTLYDFISLAAYTGARRGELADLKVSDVTESQSIRIGKSKTKAGIREVPIHSKIQPLVKRLVDDSKDGYLIECEANKRGDALGKRYAIFVKGIAIDARNRRLVFHSIRKSFVTALENAGVSENVTADIVGHEKPRITYGLYSGGASLEVKRKAIELLSYSNN